MISWPIRNRSHDVACKVQNGVIEFSKPANLPEGRSVTVFVAPAQNSVVPDQVTEQEHRRRKAALAEILAMPNENRGDTFSGADHDQVLYGDQS